MDKYNYQGKELQLFEEAKNWKKYISREISAYIKGNVLEVGAGIGETTSFLINNKVAQWTCLEPDKNNYINLHEKLIQNAFTVSCNVIHGTLNTLDPGAKYDTILYIDVLEHIEDDNLEIRSALKHLNDGGHIVVLSPAFQFLSSPFDHAIGHYRRYTKQTLRKIFIHNKLIEIKLFYLEVTGMFLLLINKFLFRKKYPSRAVIWIWDGIFIPLSTLIDKIFFYSLGKSIIGVWQYNSDKDDH